MGKEINAKHAISVWTSEGKHFLTCADREGVARPLNCGNRPVPNRNHNNMLYMRYSAPFGGLGLGRGHLKWVWPLEMGVMG